MQRITITSYSGYNRWLIGLVLILGVGLTGNLAGLAQAVTAKRPLPTVHLHPKIAIIIDDVGLVSPEQHWNAEFYKIAAPLDWSVIPFRPFTRACAISGKAHGFQVMLHLPVDPFQGRKNPGIGFIVKGSSPATAVRQFETDLAQVPEAQGVNNHMGNLGPEDSAIAAALMAQVHKHHLFFIDSLTGPHSIIGSYAQRYMIPHASRDVFIDDQNSMNYKLTALRRLITIARKYGEAIGIGHIRPGTAKAILSMLPVMKREGIEIVPVSQLVRLDKKG